MKRVQLTRQGYEKMAQELEDLKNKRKGLSQAIEHARSLGDLKENAEYHAAKEVMAHNEARINELEDKLGRVDIIDDAKIDSSKVYIGATVTLLDLETDENVQYTLVGPDEANPNQGLISTSSPVGKALLGHAVGEEISIKVPAGDLKFKITKISRS